MAEPNPSLPIYQVLDSLISKLSANKNVILQAEPGAGKSTAVPLELLKKRVYANQKILMLEPRRMAAKSLAHYLAQLLGEDIGQTVGYRIKNDTRVSNSTKLEILTEGVLTRIIQADPELKDIGLIIFDEFHERSLNADIALLLTKEVQNSIREDLQVMIMSATIDSNMVATYLDNCEVIECPGKVFPVETQYQKTHPRELPLAVLQSIRQLLDKSDGNILVFLPGIAEINRCLEHAKEAITDPKITMLPLHGSLPLEAQERAISQSKTDKRKVIFSTNIAETSLTIQGITGVIDSGLERTLSFEPNSGMTRLETNKISKASATQRKGRAGRLSEGYCIRLWSESEHQALNEYQVEEILNADLSDTILELAKWGTTEFTTVDWLTPPPLAHFESARTLLFKLGLISKSGKITPLGVAASKLPISPRLAVMLLLASTDRQQKIACDLAALLSERDILINAETADLHLRLTLFEETVSQIKHAKNDVRLGAVKSAKDTARNLKERIKHSSFISDAKTSESGDTTAEIASCLLLHAFPERLAKRRGKNSNRYILANGKGVSLDLHDSLIQHEWLVVNHCDLREREGKVFSALAINPELIESEFPQLIEERTQNKLNEENGGFSAEKVLVFENLELRSLGTVPVSQNFVHEKLKSMFAKKGEELLHWNKACEGWLNRAVWLAKVIDDFPAISKESVFGTVDDWLFPYIGQIQRMSSLKKVDVLPLLQAILSWEQAQSMEQLAPIFFQTPSGKKVPIEYDSDQGPKVSVVLQEMFGATESPKLANSISIRFELLSPAKRPIQVTSDIGGFWKTSYVEVAKEMRSKYPKHRWPEDPMNEKPGRSIKPKN